MGGREGREEPEKVCAETQSRVGWPVVREISSAGFWWSRFGAA